MGTQIEVAQSAEKKLVHIFVNTVEVSTEKEKLSYDEVVIMAYPNPDFANNTYKVTYFRKNDNHEGVLTKGGKPVEETEAMVFTVVPAVRS